MTDSEKKAFKEEITAIYDKYKVKEQWLDYVREWREKADEYGEIETEEYIAKNATEWVLNVDDVRNKVFEVISKYYPDGTHYYDWGELCFFNPVKDFVDEEYFRDCYIAFC